MKTVKEVLIPDFYTVEEGAKEAKCDKCSAMIRLGVKNGRVNHFRTLVEHLQSKTHHAQLAKYEKAVVEWEEGQSSAQTLKPTGKKASGSQPTIAAAFAQQKKIEKGSAEQRRYDDLMMEFLAECTEPFLLVEKNATKRLFDFLSRGRAPLASETYYRRMLEPVYDRVVVAVKKILHESLPFVGLTVDGWSDLSSKASLLSVTAHVINKGAKVKLSLSTIPLEESHTGDYMLEKLREALVFWDIDPERVVSITRDNAANITKTVRDFGSELLYFTDVPCGQHTMCLVLEEGLESQPATKRLLERVREVVNHFSSSLESPRRLEQIQKRADRPVLRLKSYARTRWDSNLEMVERVVDVEESLRELCVQRDHKVPVVFSDCDYDYMRGLISHLGIFREFRLEMSKDSATLGPLLSFIRQLEGKFQQETQPGLSAMRRAQLRELRRPDRFGSLRERPGFLLAEALDPRLKSRGMTEDERERVLALLPTWSAHAEDMWSAWEAKVGSTEPGPSSKPSPAKKARTEEPGPSSSQLWPSTSNESVHDQEEESCVEEYRRYEKERRVSKDLDPVEFWWGQGKSFPHIRKLALRLSTACPSQVPSEQLFSTVGQVSVKSRKSLRPDNLEKLVFLKRNFPLVRDEY